VNTLARENGTYAMVAMDQRESLRTMFRDRGFDDSDERVRMFKTAVARGLAPHASGFLIEPQFLEDVRPLVPRGLIMAFDLLEQERGGIVEDTRLGEVDEVPEGVVALKLLVIWRDDEQRARRVDTARRFVELALAHGLLSVLEPVVRGPAGFDREAAIVEAAAELGTIGCDLYKC
jgi:sulfofructosephosphate aldolase